jgi:hypothetical protein
LYLYQTIPISVGSLTITNIPKYTLKFRLSKVRNSDTEKHTNIKHFIHLYMFKTNKIISIIILLPSHIWLMRHRQYKDQISFILVYFSWLIFLCLTPLSAISWQPVLVVEEAGASGENHRPWDDLFSLWQIAIFKMADHLISLMLV